VRKSSAVSQPVTLSTWQCVCVWVNGDGRYGFRG